MKAKSIIATGMIAAASIAGSVFLTGCDAVSGIVGDNPITNALSTSKKTTAEDYQKYVAVQDPSGTPYVSVIYLQQKGSTDVSQDLIKSTLEKAGVNWYQLIVSSAMGTNQQQYAYLYLPNSTTYNDVVNALNTLSPSFDGHICTEQEYKEYVDSKSGGIVNTDLYHSENTYYGPAAKQS